MAGFENAGNPKITLTSTDGKPFAISHFKSTEDCITIDYDPSVKQAEFVIEPSFSTFTFSKFITKLCLQAYTMVGGDSRKLSAAKRKRVLKNRCIPGTFRSMGPAALV